MEVLLAVVLPVFGVLATGYAATFSRVFDAEAGDALARFVYYFALPALLFHSIATKELPSEIDLGYFAAYYGGVGLTFAATIPLFRLMGFADLEFCILAAFGTIYGNTVLIGIPVILAALGEEAGLPLFLLISFHGAIFFTLVTVLVEGVVRGKGDWAAVPGRVARSLIVNPILASLMAGLAVNLSGLEMPSSVDEWADLLSDAALPCALFSLGASLRRYRIAGTLRLCAVMVFIKLVAMPIVVWLLANLVFDVEPLWAKVAVVAAAMPSGVNGYLFAVRYGKSEAEIASAVIISTALSVLTLGLLLMLLDA
ncbi:MAG: AEC family transporter [Geminicoccaceae bacterium]|nr:AEC family transporter [Geminicoccaceae bacterium]